MGIPLVDARANFLKPVKFGDAIEMASRVSEFRRSSFDVEHRLSVNGELAVEGAETRVWAARSKDDPEKIGGMAIPPDVDREIRSRLTFQPFPGIGLWKRFGPARGADSIDGSRTRTMKRRA